MALPSGRLLYLIQPAGPISLNSSKGGSLLVAVALLRCCSRSRNAVNVAILAELEPVQEQSQMPWKTSGTQPPH
jgi:hypothetical protein